MASNRVFQVVEEPDSEPTAPAASPVPNIALSVLMLSLKTLSQRAVLALADLFTLITVGTVFWLWLSIPQPDTHQLVQLGLYGVFILLANLIVRRTRR